ncbi:MAG TPA: cupin domain-containing protein [Gammaproteobacteria bacterium]|nr:cupin domain-containing protein [Gammaproteobacteria bacterium]
MRNLFSPLPASRDGEMVEALVETGAFRLERIVSLGQSTDWLEQDRREWVLLVSGAARLEFADGAVVALGPGDCLDIPAHFRHRVQWTDPERPSLWLALHYLEDG